MHKNSKNINEYPIFILFSRVFFFFYINFLYKRVGFFYFKKPLFLKLSTNKIFKKILKSDFLLLN
jgi:hypothetical protein